LKVIALHTLFTGKNFLDEEKIHSTNSRLAELSAEKRLPEGTVVRASYQESGKGYSGNTWESEPGKNLLLSILYYPVFLPVHRQFLLNQMVCVAVASTLQGYLKETCKIKWPNDLYVDDQKLGGILIENTISGSQLSQSIVGIGLNLNQETFPAHLQNPVSLKMVSGKEIHLDLFTANLLENLDAAYLKLQAAVAYQETGALQTDYMGLLYRSEELHEYIYREQRVKAKIIGINPEGKLLLQAGNRCLACNFKEIRYVI